MFFLIFGGCNLQETAEIVIFARGVQVQYRVALGSEKGSEV